MKQGLIDIKMLPYRYRKIGFWMLLSALPVALALVGLLLATGSIADPRAFFSEWNYSIVYYPLIVALALLVFSEERQEDEMVQSLRYKSLVSGVYFLVVALLLLPFYANIYTLIMGKNSIMPDVGGMLGTLLLLLAYIYGSFRYNLHYMRKKLTADAE
ncbi:hypothetical protein [Pontibacter akesuensis]|uniref:Uncharacterized protein n=1 Tax=Pontibacter akesuensis TaxID=388950 RepID=A0A1I7IH03_9BACT|nr:hypothetical protein [Pontibacter akesuensis]GHA67117.1 hypothetical protein GCM10007389_20310 [Pontibacter akesuensis]SFU72172.1 hypothetical protein SAMN04487941_2202 [Pontibacter akesuensis]